jgi:hypothetical protein
VAEAGEEEAARPSPIGHEVEPEEDMAYGERMEYEAEEEAAVAVEVMPIEAEVEEEEEEEAQAAKT